MEETRAIYFEYDNNIELISFGSFALCMYYATQLNIEKAKKMLEATMSEWNFRVEYDLSKEDLTSDNENAHFVVSEIQETIIFLENEVIPSLINETQDLLFKYGGKSNFVNLYYNSVEYLKFNGINQNEYYDSDNKTLAHYMTRLKMILQHSISTNRPCIVYVK